MLRLTTTLAFALLAGFLVSCRAFEVERQRAWLRYHPEEDVLDLVLSYEGVGAAKEGAAETAAAAEVLGAMADGRRRMMLFDWPFDFDLERLLVEMRARPEEIDAFAPGTAEAWLEYAPNIAVRASRLATGEAQELCLLQRWRFERASRFLQLVDRALCALVQNELGSGGSGSSTADPATDALLLTKAVRGGSWIRFEGERLEVSVPMTPRFAAERLVHVLAAGRETEWPTQLLDGLAELRVTGEEARLTFAPGADGWISFAVSDPGREALPDAREHLREARGDAEADLEGAIRAMKGGP